MNFWSFLFGKTSIRIKKEKSVKLLNICSKLNINYSDFTPQNEFTEISFYKFFYSKITKKLTENKIDYEVVSECGLPKILKDNYKRVGLIIGFIFGVFLLYVSSQVVWKIEIIGNEKISTNEIVENLNECGLTLGKFIKKLDKDNIKNRLLLTNDNLSWVSINFVGTSAVVEIRESENNEELKEKANENFNFANLISKYDAEVESVLGHLGQSIVKKGDYVREGDVLISGIYKDKNGHQKLVRANGEVYGTVIKSYCVVIPYKKSEKIEVKRKLVEKKIIFFDKSLKVFGNSRKIYRDCDIINNKYVLSIFGTLSLPIAIEKSEAIYYETAESKLDEQEMIDMAYVEIKDKIKIDFSDDEITSAEYYGLFTEDGYQLCCNIRAYSLIGEIKEIKIK